MWSKRARTNVEARHFIKYRRSNTVQTFFLIDQLTAIVQSESQLNQIFTFRQMVESDHWRPVSNWINCDSRWERNWERASFISRSILSLSRDWPRRGGHWVLPKTTEVATEAGEETRAFQNCDIANKSPLLKGALHNFLLLHSCWEFSMYRRWCSISI